MANRPLLIFLSPTVVDKTNKTGFGGPIHIPSKRNQISKFDRKITELERVLENKSAFLQQGAVNIIPEMILVLETAGEISEFFKAVRKTPGMEFLAEYQQEMDADESFYILDKEGNRTSKPIDTRFYLTLTNQTALMELISYWNEYKKNPNQQHFRRGTTKFRTLFEQLKDIRPYGLKDRIIDTGIEEYINDLKTQNVENVKFEIELIFKSSSEQNDAAFNEVVELLRLNQGNVVNNSRVIIPDIFYHAFIAEAPIQSFNDLSESTAIRFLKSNQILFFRPVGQLVALSQEFDEELPSIEEPPGLSSGNPIVALLDSLPLQNHALLQDRLIIDDPFNFSSNYLPQKRFHGTAMASLILHGALNDANSQPLLRPIYVCPIMKPDDTFEAGEFLPNDKLPLDIIHAIVKRLIEEDDTSPAIAPDVKLINFSIGDRFRPFQNNLSSWAKLIDWLSYKYDLLFIVSAGNYSDNFVLNINSNDFDALDSNQIQNISLQHIVTPVFS